jgi:adenine-specific DNA methylase
MVTKYEVRQSVQSVSRRWQEVVATEVNERLGKLTYQRLKKEHPEEYFELVEVTWTERCLHYSSSDS